MRRYRMLLHTHVCYTTCDALRSSNAKLELTAKPLFRRVVAALYHAVRRGYRRNGQPVPGRILHPPGAPTTHLAPAQSSSVDPAVRINSSARRGVGKFDVADGFRQDRHDLGVPAVDPGPAFTSTSGEVVSRDGVGDIGLRGHPLELDEPASASGERPKGRDHAVDRRVLAVALRQRRLASRVVDERHNGRRHQLGEGGEGDDLGEHLEHIDVRPACGEQLDKPRRHNTMVVEDPVADPQYVSPSICGALVRRRVHAVWHVSCLVSPLAVSEKGVGVEHGHVQLGGVEGHKPGPRRRQDIHQGLERRRQARREGVIGPGCRVGGPGVDGLGRSSCHGAENRHVSERPLCPPSVMRRPARGCRRVGLGEAVPRSFPLVAVWGLMSRQSRRCGRSLPARRARRPAVVPWTSW